MDAILGTIKAVEDRLNQRMDALLGASVKSGETGASAQQISALEKRIAALEAQPKGLSYEGTWEAGRTYRKGQCVTFGGSMWVALDTNIVRPGDQNFPKAWQLAVKRGAEGKPGKDAQ